MACLLVETLSSVSSVYRTVTPHIKTKVSLVFLDNPTRDFTSVFFNQKAITTGKHLVVGSSEN